jgi:hypothetical protein
MNLETDFIKYESTGSEAYYGYTNPGTDTASKSWSIRKIVGTGPSLDVTWNSNDKFIYTAIWDNKEDHFTTPGVVSASLTSSVTPATSYQQVLVGLTWSSVLVPDKVKIDVIWSEVSGVDRYRVTVADQNGVIYNELNAPYVNPWNRGDKFTTETTGTKYTFRGISGMTYSISVSTLNQAGTSTVNYTYLT